MKAPNLPTDDFERQAAIGQAFNDIGLVRRAEARRLWLPDELLQASARGATMAL